MISELFARWDGSTYRITLSTFPPSGMYQVSISNPDSGDLLAPPRILNCVDRAEVLFERLGDREEVRLLPAIGILVELCRDGLRTGELEGRVALTPFIAPTVPPDCRGVTDSAVSFECSELIRNTLELLRYAQEACVRQIERCNDVTLAELERAAAAFFGMAIAVLVASAILAFFSLGASGWLLLAALVYYFIAEGYRLAAEVHRGRCRDAGEAVRENNRRLNDALRNLNSGMVCCPSWIPLELRNTMLRPCEPR